MIFTFRSQEIPSLAQLGGKAKALIETTQAGFNVPEGFVLSADFFKAWIDQIKSTNLWREFSQSANRETCAALQENARRLRFTPEQRTAIEPKGGLSRLNKCLI